MRKFHISPAAPADLAGVYQVFRTATPVRGDAVSTGFLLSKYTVEAFGEFLFKRDTYVVQKRDEAIGFVVSATPTPDQMGPIQWFKAPISDHDPGDGAGRLLWIKMVAVLPTYKRQGVATALYRHLFQKHPQSAFITGLYESPLDNRASSAFHLALGFQRVGVIERSTEGVATGEAQKSVTGIYYRPSLPHDPGSERCQPN